MHSAGRTNACSSGRRSPHYRGSAPMNGSTVGQFAARHTSCAGGDLMHCLSPVRAAMIQQSRGLTFVPSVDAVLTGLSCARLATEPQMRQWCVCSRRTCTCAPPRSGRLRSCGTCGTVAGRNPTVRSSTTVRVNALRAEVWTDRSVITWQKPDDGNVVMAQTLLPWRAKSAPLSRQRRTR